MKTTNKLKRKLKQPTTTTTTTTTTTLQRLCPIAVSLGLGRYLDPVCANERATYSRSEDAADTCNRA